jgi:hypothetical protein
VVGASNAPPGSTLRLRLLPLPHEPQWARLKATDQEGWDRAVEIDEALRNPDSVCTRGFRQELYLHRSCVPLAMITFTTLPPNTISPMTVGECQGLCGL